MKTSLKLNGRTALALASIAAGLALTPAANSADSYHQINLAADLTGVAPFVDANLVNPWGLLSGPGDHLIVADNHAGVVTFYRRTGQPAPLTLAVPAPGGGAAAPTDLGWNWSERSFVVGKGKHRDESLLLFVTEDGTIAGWNPKVAASAVTAVDNSGVGAIYKGMSLGGQPHRPMLYAANFGQGVVEIYDGKFHLVKSFTDPGLAGLGYAPFGIRNIGRHLFVTFAFKASPEDGDETAGPGLGYVDEFDAGGVLLRRVASQGPLNAPWGLEMAPRNFGKFSGALLVGNFGDGAINAFNPTTGAFLGQLTDAAGKVIQIDGLWGLAFGNGPAGPSLYFTAGPGDEDHGLLGVIRPDVSAASEDRD